MSQFILSLSFVLWIPYFAEAQTYKLYEGRASSSPKPALIFVHGGAWVSGSISQYDELALKLAAGDKYCAVLAEYSLAPTFQHPQPIKDFEQILKSLQKEKSKLCDFHRLVLVGHSAGAHLIAFWATEHDNSAVKAFVGLEGIYDIPALAKKWPSYKSDFLIAEFGAEKNWSKASPGKLSFKGKAPWLIVHSQSDELVDQAQSENFQRHLKSQKINSEILILKNENHFEVVQSLGSPKSSVLQKIEELIAK